MTENYKSKKGCFFWGCLIMIIICIIAGICIFIVYRKVSNAVSQFTSETPVEIAKVEYSPQEKAEADKKVKSFIDDLKKGESAEAEFTDRELNIYLDSQKDTKGKVILSFEGNKIKSTLNVPLKGIPVVDGRYLVGDAEFKVNCDDGKLNIKLESLESKGEKVPAEAIKDFTSQNLADHLYNNPKIAPMVKRIKTIKMENNKLFIEVAPEEQ